MFFLIAMRSAGGDGDRAAVLVAALTATLGDTTDGLAAEGY